MHSKKPACNERQNASAARDRRRFFRVAYPRSEKRYLNINGRDYRVIDVSLRGIKVLCDDTSEFKIGQLINAKIWFHDETAFDLRGKIIRTVNNEVIIKLSTQIPGDKINREQIYLRNKYVGYC